MNQNNTKSTKLTATQWPPREVLEHAQQHGRHQGTPTKTNTKEAGQQQQKPPSTPTGRTTTTNIPAASNTHTTTMLTPKMTPSRRVATLVAPPSSVQEDLDWGFPRGLDEEGSNNKNNDASKEVSGAHRRRRRRLQL